MLLLGSGSLTAPNYIIVSLHLYIGVILQIIITKNVDVYEGFLVKTETQ